jgi:hypothetical protein
MPKQSSPSVLKAIVVGRVAAAVLDILDLVELTISLANRRFAPPPQGIL